MADADAQRLSPRGRDDPSFLGGGAHLRPSRPGSGPPKRRHPRAAVESVRPDAGGPADGLGRATELPVTTRRDGRTEMTVLAEGNVASRIPAQDLRRARSFYAEKLGLEPVEERPGGLRYRCGNGEFTLFESAGAAAGDHTQMAWEVDDLEEAIAELRERGVIVAGIRRAGTRDGQRDCRGRRELSQQGGRRGEGRLVQGQRGQPTCHRSSRDLKYSAACGQPGAFCRATPKTQAETVIRQIPRICAAQLTSAPGPLSEQNDGDARLYSSRGLITQGNLSVMILQVPVAWLVWTASAAAGTSGGLPVRR